MFVWAAAVGASLYLFVTPNDTEFRLELVLVPFATVGLAALAVSLDRRAAARRETAPRAARPART